MEVYILFHFSHFHSVWDSKEKAVEFVRQYTMTFKKLKNAGPENFYITKATMNNSKYDMANHMIWSSWYQGRQEIKELYEQSMTKEELKKEGYKPVSRLGLMWVKDDE